MRRPGAMNDDNTERALVFFHRPDEGAQRQAAAGILVFRVKLEDAAKTIAGRELMNFSTFAPDFVFKIGDSVEGVERLRRAVGLV